MAYGVGVSSCSFGIIFYDKLAYHLILFIFFYVLTLAINRLVN
jgi:hypothetical protein